MKTCPNPECGYDKPHFAKGVIWRDRVGNVVAYDVFVVCGVCFTRGPKTIRKTYADAKPEAERLWDALPRREEK